ncbi:hypothetical protein KKH43_03730 [Patescibacteria group bacterium]|nr:hypothetical protein [Patescibacteria group bacterium]
MSETQLLITCVFILSFGFSWWLFPLFIRMARSKKVLLEDMNKFKKPKVPGLGGLALVSAFGLATTFMISTKTIFDLNSLSLELLYPALLTVFIMAFGGFVDDVLILTFRPAKIILAIVASVPMINTFYHIKQTIFLPYLPEIHLGGFYPLLIIPLFIVFGSNAINIMADFDGLSPGNSVIITAGLFVCAWLSGSPTGMFIFATLGGTLIVLYIFNKYPAKIFTGNIGTLFIGSVLAAGALVSNVKLPFLIIMIPYAVHFLLQQRRSLKHKTLFKERPRERGLVSKNGELKSEYTQSYGLTHFVMIYFRRFMKVTEKRLVYSIMCIQLLFAIVAVFVHIGRIY